MGVWVRGQVCGVGEGKGVRYGYGGRCVVWRRVRVFGMGKMKGLLYL